MAHLVGYGNFPHFASRDIPYFNVKFFPQAIWSIKLFVPAISHIVLPWITSHAKARTHCGQTATVYIHQRRARAGALLSLLVLLGKRGPKRLDACTAAAFRPTRTHNRRISNSENVTVVARETSNSHLAGHKTTLQLSHRLHD